MILKEDKFKIKAIAKDTLSNKKINVSFTPPDDDDALSVASSFSSTLSSNSNFNFLNNDKNSDYERAIIDCRIISLHPLIKKMLDHIELEAFPVSSDVTGRSSKINVKIDTDELNGVLPQKIIDQIQISFTKSQKLLKFKVTGSKKFRKWFIDGKQAYHVIGDGKDGIVELRDINVLNLRKIRKEIKDTIDGVEVIVDYHNKYIFSPGAQNQNQLDYLSTSSTRNIEIDESSVIYITSGLTNETQTRAVSHLEPLIKSVQNLNMIEDAHTIMHLSSASRTRIFYVDIGQHQSQRAGKIINEIQSKLKFNTEYDTKTGRLKDNRRFLSVLNDIFIPRLSGSGQTTEVKQMAGDDNLDKISFLEYSRNDLIEKFIVPKQRLTANQSFSLGKSNELSREEAVFHKQIEGLRQRYTDLFHEIIKRDLIMRNIMSGDDYEYIRDDIYFIFPTDNHYKMLLEFEILDEKISRINSIGLDPKIFFPIDVVARTICGYTDEELASNKQRYLDDILFVQNVESDRQALEYERTKEFAPETFDDTATETHKQANYLKE